MIRRLVHGNNVAFHLCTSGATQSIESINEIVSVLGRLWETDSIEIKKDHHVHQGKPMESEILKPVFNDEDNRYEVNLPWPIYHLQAIIDWVRLA